MFTFTTAARRQSILGVALKGMLVLVNILVPSLSFAGGYDSAFVPGEVMAKFRTDSEANRLLLQSIQSSPPNIEMLTPVTRLLADKTAIPLQIKQILSGGWVLLVVDADKLANQAAAKLRQQDAVVDVALKPSESKAVGVPELKEMDITFRSGSSERKLIEEKLAGANDDRFAGLIRELAKNVDLPLLGKTGQGAHLIIQIDLRELTSRFAERLRALPEIIDSVQLNYVKTIM